MAVILALWALVGIGTALAGRPVAGMEGIGLATERAEDPLVYISFFGVHRNLTAACFVCAAGLLLYQCRRGSSRLWRALTAAYLPLAFCAVALQHSRSNYLALAVLMGLSLSYALGRLRRWPGGAAGRAAALGVLAVSVLVIYMGMGAVSDGMMALSRSLRENAPAPVAAAQEPADAAVGAEGSGKAADVMEIVDPRSTIEDLGTLSGRLTIWRAALQSLGEKPSIALIGQPEKTMMDRTNEINGTSHVHMHNILVQQLMLAGIPGLLLYCLFLGMVLKKLLPALFRYGGDSGARQAIAALLAALLIYGVFEPLLCSRTAAASLLFCLCAGRLEA